MADTLKQKVIKGSIWKILGKHCRQGVGFVVGMVLAQLLTSNDFDTVALVAIFITIANVLMDGGFGTAQILKKEFDVNSLNVDRFLSIVC